jgi:hypothetical protein
MISTGKTRTTRRITCPSSILSTTNPTWAEPTAWATARPFEPFHS